MSKIFIDAGHGGHDGGASGSRSKEKDNCLNIAKATRKYLRELGHTVKMSRTTDNFHSLTKRADTANNWGADIFISIHNNSAANKSARGFETFIYNGNVSANTRKLQNNVHDVIAKGINTQDRGKKRANFAVVRQTSMPAVLVEYAFISNKQDENILINDYDDLGRFTANGVAKYYGQKEIGKSKPKPNKPAKDDDELSSKEYDKLKKQIDSLKFEIKNKEAKASTSDTPDPSHEKSWDRAEDKGLLKGKPHKHLTREQFATVLMRSVYNDARADEYAEKPIEWAIENEISNGERPQEMLTRQQGIAIQKRTYDLIMDRIHEVADNLYEKMENKEDSE